MGCKGYCIAMGKGALAYLPREERARLFQTYPIDAETENSIRALDKMEKHLERVRFRAYSADNEEAVTVAGICRLVAPVIS